MFLMVYFFDTQYARKRKGFRMMAFEKVFSHTHADTTSVFLSNSGFLEYPKGF